jgi:hypothetical protein
MSGNAILVGDFDCIGPFDSPERALDYKEKHRLDRYEVWPLRAPEPASGRGEDEFLDLQP